MKDVLAYNVDQHAGNTLNVVNLLMEHQRITLQYGLQSTETLIQEALRQFLASEQKLFPQPQDNPHTTPLWSRLWPTSATPLSRLQAPMENLDEKTVADVHRYIQGMKDVMVGTVNWGYETEMYFGTKGEDVRTFGWVFLTQRE